MGAKPKKKPPRMWRCQGKRGRGRCRTMIPVGKFHDRDGLCRHCRKRRDKMPPLKKLIDPALIAKRKRLDPGPPNLAELGV